MENKENLSEYFNAPTAKLSLTRGFEFLITNFRRICFNWQFFAISAIIAAILILMLNTSPFNSIVAIVFELVLLLFSSFLLEGYIVRIILDRIELGHIPAYSLRNFRKTICLGYRTMKFSLLVILPVFVLLFSLFLGVSYLVSHCFEMSGNFFLLFEICVITIMMFLTVGLLPSAFMSLYDYVLIDSSIPKCGLFKSLKLGSKLGFSYWGRIFSVLFVCGLGYCASMFIVGLPTDLYVFSLAEMQKSIAIGDIASIPNTITLFCSFLLVIQSVVLLMANLFFSLPIILLCNSLRKHFD